MNTGLEDKYVLKNNKKLRLGYTTGSCAAGAAKAAAEMLLTDREIKTVKLMTPKGILLYLEILDVQRRKGRVTCAVRKDGGDDPDMTNGMLIYATVEKSSIPGVTIDGGKGIGRVTRKGLDQKIGEAAINTVPRAMILREVQQVQELCGYQGGISVLITSPQGEEVGRRTFNPRLGIQGGISILGTTGIVEPMSETALIKSIEVEMNMRLAQGEEYLLVTPGNYGASYLKEYTALPFEKNIKCSNFVGETLDMALSKGVKGILFISHIGKFVKVAGGIMNTHSRQADSRAEILAANAIRGGADINTARKILDTGTTDEALEILIEAGCLRETIDEVTSRIQYYLNHHTYGQMITGALIFSQTYGYLGETENAGKLIKLLKGEQ